MTTSKAETRKNADFLESLSSYFSYTDYIPLLSIPSVVVHLIIICAIRTAIFGQAFLGKTKEDFQRLTRRKLDNWNHLKKAIATFSIVGTFTIHTLFLPLARF